MGEIRLLDCTLRDGGYVNDWKFGHNNIVNIFERLVSAGVDIIEVGFLDERREHDFSRTLHLMWLNCGPMALFQILFQHMRF